MNQILLSNLRAHVIAKLEGLVEWDRYGIREEDDSGFIFGWIKREDRNHDFVVVRFWLDWEKNGRFFCSYDTSSKKHSREIGIRLGSDLKGYTECVSARGLVPDGQLVRWQRDQVSMPDMQER